MTSDAAADTLAAEFDLRLRWYLSAVQYAAVIARNRHAWTDAAVCASHDYLDANEAIEAAFQVVIGRPSVPACDADTTLIDAAWSRWRVRFCGWPGHMYAGPCDCPRCAPDLHVIPEGQC